MRFLPAGLIFLYPLVASSLTLDQKISLKLIESLWEEERFAQAEEEINKFLSKYDSPSCDESLLKLKADLLIKKKDFKEALGLLNTISEKSDFIYERLALCLYELKEYEQFVTLFETYPQLHQIPFGQKVWDVGLAEAISQEQNLDKKQILIAKASRLYESDLENKFEESKALSYALIQEDKKDYQKAYELYEQLFIHTKQESYQLSMARMLSHFNPKQALEILESLRWKSGTYGVNAAMFAMQIMDQHENFHSLYNLSFEELKIAPEGFRKAKIALYHLKSLFYLKLFDRISDFYFTYNPHTSLKSQDLQLAITLISKTFLIRNEITKLEEFYQTLEKQTFKEAQITAGRILAKNYLEKKDYQKAQVILKDLHNIDPVHVDEYLTTLGCCFLNTQAYEVAEDYFIKVITTSSEKTIRQKAISYLFELPKVYKLSVELLNTIENQIDWKSCPKAALWLAEKYKAFNQEQKALDFLNFLENKQTYKYQQIMGELVEKHSLQESIGYFEKALILAEKNEQKAYIHNKLFIKYFDHDKEKAIDHLFQSINLHTLSIPDHLFDGLASYLYQKATAGVKLYIGDQEAKEKASRLLRLLSYKTQLNETENTLYAKILRKLCRFEEGLKILEGSSTIEQKLELARIYNQLGDYAKCDLILEQILKVKPYTLFIEGQKTLLTKICLHYDRLEAEGQNETALNDLENLLRVLTVCLQDPKDCLSFEVDLLKQIFFKKEIEGIHRLQFHPFLNTKDSGSYRKILNYIINKKMTKESALSIEDQLSDNMEWILIKLFGANSCLK